MKIENILRLIGTLGFSLALAACGNHGAYDYEPVSNKLEDEGTFKAYPLLWESQHPEGKAWSNHVLELIHNETPGLLHGTADIETFCPRYANLNTQQRVNFWGLLVSAMVKYESRFIPTSRMKESSLGIDFITGKPVYSEGLLQLSYQDVRPYPFCEFDWHQDKSLKATDPNKTILDPFINLSCGVKILARQVKNRDRIIVSAGAYWAVLKLSSKNSKIPQIAALTKKMPGCM